MPLDGWREVPIAALLTEHFAGEWGYDPIGGANAWVLRATNLAGRALTYGNAAPRLVPVPVLARKQLEDGDLILEASGGSPDQPVGRVARFVQDDAPRHPFVSSNFFRTLRLNDSVDSRYAELLLQQLASSIRIRPLQRQTTGIINLDFARYLQTRVALPESVDEQRAIVSVIDASQAAVSTVTAQISQLRLLREELRERVLERTAQGVEPQPLSTAASSIDYGHTPARTWFGSGGVPIIRITDLIDGQVSWDALPRCARSTEALRSKADPGDLLVARIGSIGVNAMVDRADEAVFASYLVRVKPGQGLVSEYAAEALQSAAWWRYVRTTHEGSVQPQFNATLIGGFPLAVPDPEVQRSAVEVVSAATSEIEALQAERVKLEALGEAVRGQLLAGEVRI